MKWVVKHQTLGARLAINESVFMGCYNCWFHRVLRWYLNLGE